MRSVAPEPSSGLSHFTIPRGIPAFAPFPESVIALPNLLPRLNIRDAGGLSVRRDLGQGKQKQRDQNRGHAPQKSS